MFFLGYFIRILIKENKSMKCEICKSEWNNLSQTKLDKCPFCGASLDDANNAMTQEEYYIDEYGARYSSDRKQLINAKDVNVEEYSIKEGTEIICDKAFDCQSYIVHDLLWGDELKTPNCINIKRINIPNSVISIGKLAFRLTRIETIELPDSIREIGQEAFREAAIKYLTFPRGVTHINNYTFVDSAIRVIHFHSSLLIGIGDYAFENCENLESIELPDTVKTIGQNVFANCHNLKSIYFPDSVLSIGVRAFYGCEKMHTAILSRNIKVIEEEVFSYSGLKNVIIPEGVNKICEKAFYNCI